LHLIEKVVAIFQLLVISKAAAFNNQPPRFTVWRLFASLRAHHSLNSPACWCVSIGIAKVHRKPNHGIM